MPIWTYTDARSAELVHSLGDRCHVKDCAFCASPLLRLADRSSPGHDIASYTGSAIEYRGFCSDASELQVCPICGWWVSSLLTGRAPFTQHDDGYLHLYRACGVLRELDLNDISTPVEELRRYLLARYDDRLQIHPKKLEDIVGSVFQDFGYQVRVTSFSGDEGIDVFVFDGNNDAMIGVQVKRQHGKIKAEQIRSFVGALVLKGITNGIFVTTSSYQKGAVSAALAAQNMLGMGISLMDATRFYDALKITQRHGKWDPDDTTAPYFACWKEMSKPFPPAMGIGVGHLVYGHAW